MTEHKKHKIEADSCPYCGGKDINWHESGADGDIRIYKADCLNCGKELRQYCREVFIGWNEDFDNNQYFAVVADPVKAQLLEACKYALGVLESIPKREAEWLADNVLDELIDLDQLTTAIEAAEKE